MQANTYPIAAQRRSSALQVLFTLIISVLAIYTGLGDALTAVWWPTSAGIAAQPELPVLIGLRLALTAIGLWVLLPGLVAIIAHGLGLRSVVDRAVAILPSVAAAAFRRTLGVGMVGTLVLPNFGLAGAQPSQTSTMPAAEQAASAPTNAYRLDVSTGQRWPIQLPVRPDPDAPRLIGPTPTEPGHSPGAPAERVAGVISVPQGGNSVRLDEQTASTTLPVEPQIAVEVPPTSKLIAPSPQPASAAPRTYQVVAGDHLWAIARRTVLAEHPTATESDVSSYARLLIETNRSRLPDPSNPDLLLVGGQLALPELP
jgi:LysM repeat protein